jgi:hypothetical protein
VLCRFATHRVRDARDGRGAAAARLTLPGLAGRVEVGRECTVRYRAGDRYPCISPYWAEFFNLSEAEIGLSMLPDDAVVLNAQAAPVLRLSGLKGSNYSVDGRSGRSSRRRFGRALATRLRQLDGAVAVLRAARPAAAVPARSASCAQPPYRRIRPVLASASTSPRASGSMVDFFVGGRSLPWWLAGTSMAATTFSIDTPLYVAGVVGTRGIAGNWEWWGFAIAHVILIYIFARLWRRAEIVTDNELTELRYGGKPAAIAARDEGVSSSPSSSARSVHRLRHARDGEGGRCAADLPQPRPRGGRAGQAVGGRRRSACFVLVYAGSPGCGASSRPTSSSSSSACFGRHHRRRHRGRATSAASAMVDARAADTDFDVLAFTPSRSAGRTLQSDRLVGGGGHHREHVLRLRRSCSGGRSAARTAAASSSSGWRPCAARRGGEGGVVLQHHALRGAHVAVGRRRDRGAGDLSGPGGPRARLSAADAGLPAGGVLGMVVASLLAAFMSTVSTLINWSASYMTNDLYARFMRPQATQKELVLAGRVARP